MKVEEAKELKKHLTITRNKIHEAIACLEVNSLVLAYKAAATADNLLYAALTDLSNQFPHEL